MNSSKDMRSGKEFQDYLSKKFGQTAILTLQKNYRDSSSSNDSDSDSESEILSFKLNVR